MQEIAPTSLSDMLYAHSISSIFSIWMVSNAFLEWIHVTTSSSLCFFTPSVSSRHYLADCHSSWLELILICLQMLVKLGSYAIQNHLVEHLLDYRAEANPTVVTGTT